MTTTESNRICVSCDAPFLPTGSDMCSRCEQRQNDRTSGAKLAAWVIAALIFTLLAAAQRMHGASVITEQFLDRVAQRESNNNPAAIGKLGEVGCFQLRPIAIREVNRIYGTRYTISDASDMAKSRRIARLYMLICETRVRTKTQASVYAKYRGAR